jgi:hypothetical protein
VGGSLLRPDEDGLYLRKNTAAWDRVARFLVGAALILGLPSWVRQPLWLTVGGAVAGFQLVAAFTGY